MREIQKIEEDSVSMAGDYFELLVNFAHDEPQALADYLLKS